MQEEDSKIRLLGIVIWLIAATFFLYEFFLRTFVGSIAQQLIHDLQLSIKQFTLIGTSYYFVYGLMQIPVGVLADKFGVKKIMIFALLVCATATFLFAHSHSFSSAIAARSLMGFGSAFGFVCLLVVALNWFPKRLFGLFSGVSQFFGTMGPVLAGGPLISWLTVEHMNWRTALVFIAGFGVFLALLTVIFVRKKTRSDSDVLLYLSRDEPFKKSLEKLFKLKQAWVIAVYSMTVYISISALAAVWGTDYLQSIGFKQQSAAYMISISWIAYAIGCPLFGYLSDLTKRRKPYLVLCAALGVISTVGILYGGFKSIVTFDVLFFMLGLAATGQNIGFVAIAENVTANVKASAMGLNNGVIVVSASIFPVIIGFIVSAASRGNAASHLSSHALTTGLSLLPVVFLVALLVSLVFFKETYARPQKGFVVLRPDGP